MRRLGLALLVLVLGLALISPSEARGRGGGGRSGGHHHFHGGHRVFIGVAPSFWWGWGPYPEWWYYPPYYMDDPYATDEPMIYFQQPAAPGSSPPTAEPLAYWYYCPPAQAYYPSVASCAEPWIRVLPRAP